MNGTDEGAGRFAGAEGVERAEGAVRERFHRGLDQLPTGFAPVEAAMRQGREIRVRRRAAYGGSVVLAAAVAAGAVAISGSSAPIPVVPPVVPPVVHTGPHHLSETPGGLAEGLLASGVLDGVSWSVSEEASPGAKCLFVTRGPDSVDTYPYGMQSPTDVPGFDYTALTCASLSAPAKDPVVLSGPTTIIFGAVPLDYGAVRPDVTSLDVAFGDGEKLHLVPVIVEGTAYIVFPKPRDLVLARITAHSPRGDQYTIPFDNGRGFIVGTWYAAGQTAPPAESPEPIRVVSVVPGAWSVSVSAGPWGRCLVADGILTAQYCPPVDIPPTIGLSEFTTFDAGRSVALFFGELSPAVARVEFTDRSGKALATGLPTTVDGHVYCAVAVPLGSGGKTTYYDASGKVVGSDPFS